MSKVTFDPLAGANLKKRSLKEVIDEGDRLDALEAQAVDVEVVDAEVTDTNAESEGNSKRTTLSFLEAAGSGASLAITDDDYEVAASIGVDLNGTVEDMWSRVAMMVNAMTIGQVHIGYHLLAIRQKTPHGEFEGKLGEFGFERRSATRMMSMARFVTAQPEDQRAKLLAMPKMKVLELASADPEVVQDLLESGSTEVQDLSVRALRQRIKELSAAKANASAEVEKQAARADKLEAEVKVLREARIKTGGELPAVVEDMRLEAAALHKKAALALDDIDAMVTEIDHVPADFSMLVTRHIYGALIALQARVNGLVGEMYTGHGKLLGAEPSAADYLTDDEVLRTAQEYKELVREHEFERAERDWQREMDRPRGKGRPPKRPELTK